MCMLTRAHTPIHILDHHPICTGTRGISTAWLQLFHSGSGYLATTIPKAFTKGTAERQPNTHGHTVAQQLPALLQLPGSTQGILSPKTTRLLKIWGDTHPARKLNSLWLSNWNLLTGNEGKCYDTLSFSHQQNNINCKQWHAWHNIKPQYIFGTDKNVSIAQHQKMSLSLHYFFFTYFWSDYLWFKSDS